MRIAVIGHGYVGASVASAAKDAGHDVLAFDIDENKLQSKNIKDQYYITNDFSLLVDNDIIVIAVPTPLTINRIPDLSMLEEALIQIRTYADPGTLIINESTSFPGTLRDIIADRLGPEFLFASSPERIDPGNSTWSIKNTPRLVSGLCSVSTEKAINFYRSICEQVIRVRTPEIAEAAKLLENSFRQINIAFINEFAKIMNSLKISTFEVIDAASTKPYGFMPFFPGIGVGGHCIPIDPMYLNFIAKDNDIEATMIKAADDINQSMPEFIADQLSFIYPLRNLSIQIAGISYKPNVNDVRESPALKLIDELRRRGAIVSWHDNYVGKHHGEVSECLKRVNLGLICVEHGDVDYSPWLNGHTEILDLSSNPKSSWKKLV